ncbi:MAG TPA: MFS transporter [Burkholderiales bacterium]|nr:MFS transporter [Burkholderiales bacterium]
MNPTELRAGISLAGVFGLRMLGLFLILPVFAVHAPQLAGGEDLTLVGIALGAYGLSQAILQIPFGAASDRWGRKRVIYVGLVVFAAGSFLAAVASDIWMAIAGRALQGAGAISSVVVALAADLTRDQHRTKVMAMIGATIGLTFALSLVAAPALYRWIGMGGLFALTGGLSLGAIAVVRALVPDAPPRPPEPAAGAGSILFNAELARLNLGIFVLHLVQMAMFVVVPPLLVAAGLGLADHWMLYLPVVLVSFALMVPPILYADRRNRPKPVMLGSVALLLCVQAALALGPGGLVGFAVLLAAFFAAFNILEALLPSLVSRLAPAQVRGAAIGVYNTTQTLGLFIGGMLGGWVAKHLGTAQVFMACALLSGFWLLVVTGMRPLRSPVNDLSSLTFTIASGVNLDGLREALSGVQGVREAEVLSQERIARLKVVPGEWDEGRVRKLVTGEI